MPYGRKNTAHVLHNFFYRLHDYVRRLELQICSNDIIYVRNVQAYYKYHSHLKTSSLHTILDDRFCSPSAGHSGIPDNDDCIYLSPRPCPSSDSIMPSKNHIIGSLFVQNLDRNDTMNSHDSKQESIEVHYQGQKYQYDYFLPYNKRIISAWRQIRSWVTKNAESLFEDLKTNPAELTCVAAHLYRLHQVQVQNKNIWKAMMLDDGLPRFLRPQHEVNMHQDQSPSNFASDIPKSPITIYDWVSRFDESNPRATVHSDQSDSFPLLHENQSLAYFSLDRDYLTLRDVFVHSRLLYMWLNETRRVMNKLSPAQFISIFSSMVKLNSVPSIGFTKSWLCKALPQLEAMTFAQLSQTFGFLAQVLTFPLARGPDGGYKMADGILKSANDVKHKTNLVHYLKDAQGMQNFFRAWIQVLRSKPNDLDLKSLYFNIFAIHELHKSNFWSSPANSSLLAELCQDWLWRVTTIIPLCPKRDLTELTFMYFKYERVMPTSVNKANFFRIWLRRWTETILVPNCKHENDSEMESKSYQCMVEALLMATRIMEQMLQGLHFRAHLTERFNFNNTSSYAAHKDSTRGSLKSDNEADHQSSHDGHIIPRPEFSMFISNCCYLILRRLDHMSRSSQFSSREFCAITRAIAQLQRLIMRRRALLIDEETGATLYAFVRNSNAIMRRVSRLVEKKLRTFSVQDLAGFLYSFTVCRTKIDIKTLRVIQDELEGRFDIFGNDILDLIQLSLIVHGYTNVHSSEADFDNTKSFLLRLFHVIGVKISSTSDIRDRLLTSFMCSFSKFVLLRRQRGSLNKTEQQFAQFFCDAWYDKVMSSNVVFSRREILTCLGGFQKLQSTINVKETFGPFLGSYLRRVQEFQIRTDLDVMLFVEIIRDMQKVEYHPSEGFWQSWSRCNKESISLEHLESVLRSLPSNLSQRIRMYIQDK